MLAPRDLRHRILFDWILEVSRQQGMQDILYVVFIDDCKRLLSCPPACQSANGFA